ncbi:fatty acid desaturase [Paraburkholderia sp. SIMBA_050]
MKSTASFRVAADLAAIHSSSIIVAGCSDRAAQPSIWRSLLDIVIDWALICLAAWGAWWMGGWTIPLAIFVIGNRQRALGNLLHDAGHQNLSAHRAVNDAIAHILLAPQMFNSLGLYRRQHARHHAWLGNPEQDPDFIPRAARQGDHWLHAYVRVLMDAKSWIGSLFGHLLVKRLAARQRLGIFLWWIAYGAIVAVVVNLHFALLFVCLWVIARGTVFHAITTFREMTDHYGLEPGGIFPYTRDIPNRGFVSVLFHPHHNGYHLTHHLFPHVPYYRLAQMHARLNQTPFFNEHAIVCHAYFSGSCPAVEGWGEKHA